MINVFYNAADTAKGITSGITVVWVIVWFKEMIEKTTLFNISNWHWYFSVTTAKNKQKEPRELICVYIVVKVIQWSNIDLG